MKEEIKTILPICAVCGGALTPEEEKGVFLDMREGIRYEFHSTCVPEMAEGGNYTLEFKYGGKKL